MTCELSNNKVVQKKENKMKKVKKFFKVLPLFIYCVQNIYHGNHIKSDKYDLTSFKQIWKYCEDWESGNL